jgi:putative ABC transport system permease protein
MPVAFPDLPRSRLLMSLLCVAWGTLSILLLLAFSVGFEELFAERSRGIGEGVAIAWPSRTTKPWRGFAPGRPVPITRDDVLSLQSAVPELDLASAEFTAGETVRQGSRVLRVGLSGVEPCFARLRNLEAQPGGRFLDEQDVVLRRRVAFLGDRLAQQLFGSAAPVGRTLILRGCSVLVVGVLAPKLQDSDYGDLDRDRAWLPATSFAEMFGRRLVNIVVFRAKDPRRQSAVRAQVVAALATRLMFDPQDLGALSVWDTTEQQRMLFYIFLGFHLMLGLSGTFTMLVGGIGIANLMFLAVRRRQPQIGLKLAVGATPRQILREFLGEALLLVLLGGSLGTAAACAVVALAQQTPLVDMVGHPRIPAGLAVLCAALLALVGVLAGVFPARQAARLDPVLALRS